jgi:hypothetical protein
MQRINLKMSMNCEEFGKKPNLGFCMGEVSKIREEPQEHRYPCWDLNQIPQEYARGSVVVKTLFYRPKGCGARSDVTNEFFQFT